MAGPPSSSNPSRPDASPPKGARLEIPVDPDEEAPTLVNVSVTTDDPSTEPAPVERTSTPGPPPAEELGPGSIVAGRYRIDRIIGHGGMGAVWHARDVTLEIDVAVKLIRRDRTTPEARVRLLQEARAAARIGHPSIVRIFDFGETGEGAPFIVMELLQGEPLGSVLLRKQRLDPVIAVSTLLPVASALVAAHAKGIVHRDLKPDNIVLVSTETGAVVPKLLDFGIARLLDDDPERRFTIAGEVLGSPDYMSPEQARGEADVGVPTDVWAFSVLLYEALVGRRPFQGHNYNKLILSIITADPIPAPNLAAAEPELWGIVQRGLAKDVAERWPGMRELGAALATWAIQRGLQEDSSGTALASTWLAGGRRNQLSLQLAAATPLPGSAQPPREPEVETLTRPPFVPSRRPWLALLVIVLVALSALVYIWWDRILALGANR